MQMLLFEEKNAPVGYTGADNFDISGIVRFFILQQPSGYRKPDGCIWKEP